MASGGDLDYRLQKERKGKKNEVGGFPGGQTLAGGSGVWETSDIGSGVGV